MDSSYLQAEKRFLLLLAQYRQLLTDSDMDEAEMLVRAGELGVAFEFFCNQIYDRGYERGNVGVCSPEQFDEVTAIASAMHIDRMYWDFLDPHRPIA